MIITGDMSQRDLAGDGPSGLDVAVRVLRKIEDISFVRLTSKDIVRHPWSRKSWRPTNPTREGTKAGSGRNGREEADDL